MTNLKEQPWYKPYMEDRYPRKIDRNSKLKFQVGKIYVATKYRGGKSFYKCIKRSDSGFIFFQEVWLDHPEGDRYRYYRDVIRRKPEKGWEGADERVVLDKGTFGRVCWTGGCTLYARDQYRSKTKEPFTTKKGRKIYP